MKTTILSAATIALMSTSMGFAQTAQSGATSPSGNAAYPLRVEGTNGVVYNCKDEVVDIDGVASRQCVREGSGGGTVFGSGTGAGIGGGAAAGVGALVAVALIAGSSDSNTTTTGTGG